MPIERINDLELHFQIDGEGPETVVLINGLADELETWSYQLQALLEAALSRIADHPVELLAHMLRVRR